MGINDRLVILTSNQHSDFQGFASDQAQFSIPAVTEGLCANDEDFVVHQGRIARGLLAAFQEDVPLRVQSKFADVALLAGQRPDDRFS